VTSRCASLAWALNAVVIQLSVMETEGIIGQIVSAPLAAAAVSIGIHPSRNAGRRCAVLQREGPGGCSGRAHMSGDCISSGTDANTCELLWRGEPYRNQPNPAPQVNSVSVGIVRMYRAQILLCAPACHDMEPMRPLRSSARIAIAHLALGVREPTYRCIVLAACGNNRLDRPPSLICPGPQKAPETTEYGTNGHMWNYPAACRNAAARLTGVYHPS